MSRRPLTSAQKVGYRAHWAFESYAAKNADLGILSAKTVTSCTPDAVTVSGVPIELKPNDVRGRSSGRKQAKRYAQTMGASHGQLWVYQLPADRNPKRATFRFHQYVPADTRSLIFSGE